MLDGDLAEALKATKDEALAKLASDVSEDSLYNLMNGRPYSELSYRKENSGLTAIDGYGTIEEGGYNGRTEVREGQLHEGGALRASGIGSDEGRFGTLRHNGVPEAERFAQGEDLGRSGGLGDGRARLRRIIKGLDKDADYVPTPKLEKTYDNAKRFHDAIEKARLTQEKGLYVSLYPTDTIDHGDWKETGYSDPSMRLFLSDDNSVGFALHGEDIVSVFSDKTVADHPKSIYSILLNALEAGGRKLDCYGKGLVRLYERMGFVLDGKIQYDPTYESEEWTARKDVLGSPDVYALYWGDSSLQETLDRFSERQRTITKNYIEEQVASMDWFATGEDAYDSLMSYRDSMLELKEEGYLMAAENPTNYGKNVDFMRSTASTLVPYTTEQTVGRIKVGRPVDSADIRTLLATDTSMTAYQRSVLEKGIKNVSHHTSSIQKDTKSWGRPLYTSILSRYSISQRRFRFKRHTSTRTNFSI